MCSGGMWGMVQASTRIALSNFSNFAIDHPPSGLALLNSSQIELLMYLFLFTYSKIWSFKGQLNHHLPSIMIAPHQQMLLDPANGSTADLGTQIRKWDMMNDHDLFPTPCFCQTPSPVDLPPERSWNLSTCLQSTSQSHSHFLTKQWSSLLMGLSAFLINAYSITTPPSRCKIVPIPPQKYKGRLPLWSQLLPWLLLPDTPLICVLPLQFSFSQRS